MGELVWLRDFKTRRRAKFEPATSDQSQQPAPRESSKIRERNLHEFARTGAPFTELDLYRLKNTWNDAQAHSSVSVAIALKKPLYLFPIAPLAVLKRFRIRADYARADLEFMKAEYDLQVRHSDAFSAAEKLPCEAYIKALEDLIVYPHSTREQLGTH